MKILPKQKKKILKWSLGIGITTLLTATVVGGYMTSISKNPYKDYYRTPATDATQSFLSSFYSAVIGGANLLLLPGFTLVNPLNVALEESWFNKTGFLLIDEAYMGNKPYENNSIYFSSQVSSVQFRADEGSFITGIALGMYLNTYKEYFTSNDKNKQLTWATFGGGDGVYDAVVAFMSGFQRGIKWFNDNVVPRDSTNSLLPIKQVFLGDGFQDNFSGSFGPSGGNAIIDKFLITTEVDCLIPIAGAQTIDAVAKIASRVGQRTIVIGVDSAMENDNKVKHYNLPVDKNLPLDKQPTKILPFSSTKNIDLVASKVMDQINTPTQVGIDNLHGLGYHNIGDINNGGVGVSAPGQEYFTNALKLLDNSINDYNSAITYLRKQPDFSSMSVASDPSIDNNIYINKYTIFDKNGQETKSYNYQTYIHGYEFPKMDAVKPSSIPNNKISQQQWEQKRNFNLNNFVQRGNQKDKDKVKLILSSSDAILKDAGFCQVSYLAIYLFYKQEKIEIPLIN